MHLDIIIASPGKHSLISEVHQGLHIDFKDFEKSLELILQQHHVSPFMGVIGTEDSVVDFANSVARHLKLIHNSSSAVKLTQRKDLARECLTKNNCVVPYHRLIELDKPLEPQLNKLDWPCVIKPLHMSASRGVIRINNLEEAIDACHRVAKIVANEETFESKHLLIEQYIDGFEVAFEGFLNNGQLHQLALFDKPEPLTGPYFEETIYVTPSTIDADLEKHIYLRVAQACDAYGLKTGPIHAELRIDSNKEAWILEVANRTIGGDCARTLDIIGEYALEKLILSLSIGAACELVISPRASGVMMIPIRNAGVLQKIKGVTHAKKVENITDVKINISPGNELVPLPEGNQYLGYIFAQAETPRAVTDSLKCAHSKLEFKVAPKFNLIPDTT